MRECRDEIHRHRESVVVAEVIGPTAARRRIVGQHRRAQHSEICAIPFRDPQARRPALRQTRAGLAERVDSKLQLPAHIRRHRAERIVQHVADAVIAQPRAGGSFQEYAIPCIPAGPPASCNANRRSRGLRESGPLTESRSGEGFASGGSTKPSSEIISIVGLCPKTPQKCEGVRMDPPISLPSSRKPIPRASAAAPPPVEPPEVRWGFHGLLVVPATSL